MSILLKRWSGSTWVEQELKIYGTNVYGKISGVNSANALLDATTDKIQTSFLPDYILGQLTYGGNFVPSTGVATLSTAGKNKLTLEMGTAPGNTITLINTASTTSNVYGSYDKNEGTFYIASESGTFSTIAIEVGDWLLSNGTSWTRIDNTDAVTGVKGNNESSFRTANVEITDGNLKLAGYTLNTGTTWSALAVNNTDTLPAAFGKVQKELNLIQTGKVSLDNVCLDNYTAKVGGVDISQSMKLGQGVDIVGGTASGASEYSGILFQDDNNDQTFTVIQSDRISRGNPNDGLYANISYPSATGTLALTSNITSAINALDVSSVGGSHKYLSAISETDGKISATARSQAVSYGTSDTITGTDFTVGELAFVTA